MSEAPQRFLRHKFSAMGDRKRAGGEGAGLDRARKNVKGGAKAMLLSEGISRQEREAGFRIYR